MMPLVFTGERTSVQPPWFAPDRMGNIQHDAMDDENIVVYDSNGVAIFGRVIEGATKRWVCHLKEWVWAQP